MSYRLSAGTMSGEVPPLLSQYRSQLLIVEEDVLAAPTVDAGADAELVLTNAFTRTATENDNGDPITARDWSIITGPSGGGSGTIGTAAALSWTPTVAGIYTLRYSATNALGTGTDDVTVLASGGQAARYSASDEQHTNAISLGSQANFTVCAWLRFTADRNTWSTPLALDSGTNAVHLQTQDDGTTVVVWDDPTGSQVATGPALTVDRWYFGAISVAGAAGLLYVRDQDGTVVTDTWTSAARTLAEIWLGSNRVGEWLDGRVAAVKLWTAGLSQSELATEATRYDAARTANLSRAWRLDGTTAEQTGNGTSLIGGIGATWETGPPIPLSSSGSFTATAADVADASDALTQLLTLARSLADAAPAGDASTRSTARERAVSDSAPATDTASGFKAALRTASDTAPASDTLARAALVFSRSMSDTATTSDSLARTTARPRTPSDNAPATDSLAHLAGKSRTASDTAPATDAVIRTAQVLNRTTSDTADASDVLTRTSSRARTGSDSAPATDSLAHLAGKLRTASDSAPASETPTRILLVGKTVADTAAASDSAARTTTRPRSLADTAPAADTATGFASKLRTAADTAIAGDTLARAALVFSRTTSDTAATADSATRAPYTRARTATDIAGVTDSLARSIGRATIASDSIPLSDTVTTSFARGRTATDTNPTADAVSVRMAWTRAVADTAPGSDGIISLVILAVTFGSMSPVTRAAAGMSPTSRGSPGMAPVTRPVASMTPAP